MQISVHCRFRDQSTLVREAAVDLIGHFVLKCPDITDKYYDMIIERILVSDILKIEKYVFASGILQYSRKPGETT